MRCLRGEELCASAVTAAALRGVLGSTLQAGWGRLEQTEDLERCCLSDSTLAAGEAPPEPLISFACLNMLFRQFYFSIPLLIPSIFLLHLLYSLSEDLWGYMNPYRLPSTLKSLGGGCCGSAARC